MPPVDEQLIRFTAPRLPVTGARGMNSRRRWSPLSSFPDARPVHLAAAERDSACLPLGVVVQPFAPLSAAAPAAQQLLGADSLPRCGDCAAYICGFCQLEREGWVCALCGASKHRQARCGRQAPSLLTSTSPCTLQGASPSLTRPSGTGTGAALGGWTCRSWRRRCTSA